MKQRPRQSQNDAGIDDYGSSSTTAAGSSSASASSSINAEGLSIRERKWLEKEEALRREEEERAMIASGKRPKAGAKKAPQTPGGFGFGGKKWATPSASAASANSYGSPNDDGTDYTNALSGPNKGKNIEMGRGFGNNKQGEFNQDWLYREEMELAGKQQSQEAKLNEKMVPEDPRLIAERNKPLVEVNSVLMQKLLPVASKNMNSIDNASRDNVKTQIETLRVCLDKDVLIAGGILDMDSGKVDFFT